MYLIWECLQISSTRAALFLVLKKPRWRWQSARTFYKIAVSDFSTFPYNISAQTGIRDFLAWTQGLPFVRWWLHLCAVCEGACVSWRSWASAPGPAHIVKDAASPYNPLDSQQSRSLPKWRLISDSKRTDSSLEFDIKLNFFE